MNAPLLVEVGTEELPPLALPRLAEAFAAGLRQRLEEAGLAPGEPEVFATPRRLALRFAAVPERLPDRSETRLGPARTAAFDAAGRPTAAAEGFARSCGVAVEALECVETPKGPRLAFRRTVPGAALEAVLADWVNAALGELPVPKRMRWGAGEVEFVRPVHWVVLLHGERVVPGRVLGLEVGRLTRGHRHHHPEPIELPDASAYVEALEGAGRVVPGFAARRARIEAALDAVLQSLQADAPGRRLRADRDPALLDEITALVEWPVAIACRFDPEFLAVPAEALVLTMKKNQRNVPVYDQAGRLTEHFVVIANIDSPQPERIRAGNERVIRPRFADARFFWEQDRKRGLEHYRQKLDRAVFHNRLGTLLDKSRRIAALAEWLAGPLGADAARARRAAELCKADLMSDMVYEFPELQGTMGRYYALAQGEPQEVAEAIEQHYWPRHAGDALPAGPVARAVALADKLDTLVGIFAVVGAPRGDGDPYALRRAALGVLRILLDGGHDLDVRELAERAAAAYPPEIDAAAAVPALVEFMMTRLAVELRERHAPQAVAAVAAVCPPRPVDFVRRLEALAAFLRRPEAGALAAADKRIGNLLKKAGEALPERVDPARLREPAERALYEALERLEPEVTPLLAAARYTDALAAMARLRPEVDAFFEAVLVLDPDPALRANRLALLARLKALFTRVADFSQLGG